MSKIEKYQKGNFVIVPNRHIALCMRGAPLNVYLAICSHADENGQCFPSYKTIATETEYSKKVCIEAVKKLEEMGLLVVEKRKRQNKSATSNLYQMTLYTRVVTPTLLGGHVHVTPITQSTNSELDKSNSLGTKVPSHQKEKKLLELVNRIVGREFRVLPERGVKKTLNAFTLEEIEYALEALVADDWHADKLHEFKIDYLIRSTTIDKFLAIGKPKRDPRVYG